MDHRADVSGGDRPPLAESTRVRVQSFPLLADLSKLQLFCDQCFNNTIPRSVAIFRPVLPLVFCGVVHYPDMGGALPWRTGTLSQNEMYFLVLLARYREVNGREEFVELGATTPYIFVDNAESVAAGRERYGMPKQAATFSTKATNGLPWDLGTQQYVRVKTYQPSVEGYRRQSLLDVVHDSQAFFRLGAADETNATRARPLGPLDWLKVAQTTASMLAHSFEPGALDNMLGRLEACFSLLRATQGLTLFNLRQFADPEYPGLTRYQDLIAFRMKIGDVQSLGLLGDGPGRSNYQLRMRQSELEPIARKLGLRIDQSLNDPSDQSGAVDVVHSFLPFFAQGDLELRQAETLCWKFSPGEKAPWCDTAGNQLSDRRPSSYNTYLGPSASAFLRPQAVSHVDLKLMMVPIRRDVIAAHVASMWPRTAPVHVAILGKEDVVGLRLLAYQSRPRTEDERSGLLWMDGTYVSLSVPVKVTLTGAGSRSRYRTAEREFIATLMLHDFTTNPFMVQSLREVLGEPTTQAEFAVDENPWFASSRRVAQALRLSAIGISRSSTGARLERAPLIDILRARDQIPTVGDLTKAAARELDEDIWPVIGGVLPVISVGAVPVVERDTGDVFQRIMVTRYSDQPVAGTASEEASPRHLVRFHENERYPLFALMRSCALAREQPLAALLRENVSGASLAVPVLRYRETSTRIGLDHFEILWESTPRWAFQAEPR